MPFTVHVENFQSLSDVTVKVQGFTVITGTNNSGKSALMRAIRGAFQNARGTAFIRHGTTKATVEITFDDGRKIRWEKGKGAGDKPTYIVDGGSPLHPGQAVPDEVRDLGVRPITVGGREVWPQFAPQFTGQIFLLDQPGSVLAEAVSDVNHVSQLNEALRLAESDKRSAQSELRVRLKDQAALENELIKYTFLIPFEADVAAIEADHAKAVKIGNVIGVVQTLKDRHDAAKTAVDNLQGVEAVTVPEDALFKDAQDLLDTLGTLKVLRDRWVDFQAAIDKLAGVESIDIPQDTSTKSAYEILSDLEALLALQTKLAKAQAAVDALTGIPEIEDLDTTDAEALLDRLVALEALRGRWAKASGGVESLDAEMATVNQDLADVAKEIDTMLDGLGECPVCGSAHTGGHS